MEEIASSLLSSSSERPNLVRSDFPSDWLIEKFTPIVQSCKIRCAQKYWVISFIYTHFLILIIPWALVKNRKSQ